MGRRRKLAQYFTPQPVVGFALDALVGLGLSKARARVIDPACGAGVFLVEARRRFPRADVWGCDLDAGLAERWRAAGLDGPRVHMLIQDGLLDAPLWGVGAGQFDLVLGNPPYGLGMPRPGRGEAIEALFVRRFVELAGSGGWIALVVPEGIVASDRAQGLRDWVLERTSLQAVVALPEDTFARAGTKARTALLLARKGGNAGEETLLASPSAQCRGREALAAYLDETLSAIKRKGSDAPPGHRRRA
ncbi:MAG TPA: N-6 DNA methylase [Planctomycetota bacterium]|nr:N-6 DNA methylase [Planctomycetota bacterium]